MNGYTQHNQVKNRLSRKPNPLVIFIILFLVLNISASYASNCITDGYMDKISYNQGDVANAYINASSIFTGQKLFLYSVNNQIVDSIIVNLTPQSISNADPWMNGYGYLVSFSYIIPNNLQSGLYNWENKVFFLVKNSAKDADITIIYPSNTEAAYNEAGGKSLYEILSI